MGGGEPFFYCLGPAQQWVSEVDTFAILVAQQPRRLRVGVGGAASRAGTRGLFGDVPCIPFQAQDMQGRERACGQAEEGPEVAMGEQGLPWDPKVPAPAGRWPRTGAPQHWRLALCRGMSSGQRPWLVRMAGPYRDEKSNGFMLNTHARAGSILLGASVLGGRGPHLKESCPGSLLGVDASVHCRGGRARCAPAGRQPQVCRIQGGKVCRAWPHAGPLALPPAGDCLLPTPRAR